MKVVVLLALLLLASCERRDAMGPVSPQPRLDPAQFFTGRSAGDATLDVLFSTSKQVTVESRGTRQADGAVILDQRIKEGNKPPRLRRWVIRPLAPGRWTGSLTDAAGPVAISARGNAATIAYLGKDGIAIYQQLRLRPDRRTVDNRLTATKWGIDVATLDEVIRKLD